MSLDAEGPFEKINEEVIFSSMRIFRVPNPPRNAYYVLAAEDGFSNLYKSPAKFAQMEDISPPRTPHGLQGSPLKGDFVEVTWEENTESDLDGYRLFRSLQSGGIFASVTTDLLKETSYTDDLSNLVLGDTVYYRLDAMDINGNTSPLTKILRVARYDRTPPDAPTLYKALPLPLGVAVAWKYSSSEDVTHHELQRKVKGAPGWETIVTVENYQREQFYYADTTQLTGTCYVDTEPLERRSYEYQFIAYDKSGNASGSEIIIVRPYDSGARGEINNFSLSDSCQQVLVSSSISAGTEADMNTAISSFESNGSINNGLKNSIRSALESEGLITQAENDNNWKNYTNTEFYNAMLQIIAEHGERMESTNCTVTLSWGYNIESSVLNFQILRSRKVSGFKVYKTLPIQFFYNGGQVTYGNQSFEFVDEQIDPNVRYIYKIMAQHSDGGYSEVSVPLTVIPK